MKQILCSLAMLFFTLLSTITAQNTLIIHQKDGTTFGYGFSEKPVITYTETDLVLTTTKTVVEYPLSALFKFTFSNVETAVSGIKQDIQTPVLSLDNYMVQITGAKPSQKVSLIDIDGKVLSTFQTDANGSLSFSISDLPKGVYIIKSQSLTCKISKL